MTQVSPNALKSLGFFLLMPTALFFGVKLDLQDTPVIIMWLAIIAGLVFCIKYLGNLLSERNKTWLFLVPGAAIMFASLPAGYFGLLIGGQGLGVALMICVFGYGVYYNCKGLGTVEGIIVSIIQIFLSVFIIVLAIFINGMRQGTSR